MAPHSTSPNGFLQKCWALTEHDVLIQSKKKNGKQIIYKRRKEGPLMGSNFEARFFIAKWKFVEFFFQRKKEI